MPVTWRHRIVRVLDDDGSIQRAVLRVIEEGWIFVSGASSEPGQTDLVFRKAVPRERWS